MQKVYKVYSGKLGCMCGCKGKYSYAADEAEFGGTDRGYKIHEDEISDRRVKTITKQVLNDPDVKYEDNYAYVETDKRIKVVYFKEEAA